MASRLLSFGMIKILGALAATGVFAASAAAQTPPYIDPALRSLSRPLIRDGVAEAARARGAVTDSMIVLGGVSVRVAEEPTVGLIVRLQPGGQAELERLGGRIGSVHAGIATVRLPVSALPQLTDLREVQVVEAAHPISIQHDSSMRAIRVTDLRRMDGGRWTGLTGEGAIVAIYDTGLDFRHDDFIAADGATRVLGLWDQTVMGTPPAGFAYGHFCSRDAIQQAIAGSTTSCIQRDTHGHGTHTAGTAAGDGSAAGSGTAFQYAGVAPNAELLIVKGGNGSFGEDLILDGLRWLEAEGRRLNRPVVVNLSLGGQFGAHDGRRLYEQGIDALARPGFIVVSTSGNEGANGNVRNRDGTPLQFNPYYIHASGYPSVGSTREFTINIPEYFPITGICNDVVALSFWYAGSDRLRISVVRPDGSSAAAETGQVNASESAAGTIAIDNASAGPNPLNSDNEALIQISDCNAAGVPAAPGTYAIRVGTIAAPSGKPYHMWLYFNSVGGFGVATAGIGFDNRYIVGSPGSARTAITVGAFVTRLCWPNTTNASGSVCYVQVEDLGDLARFSAGGPTRDERLKPEITAPGLGVVSAMSRDSRPAATRIMPNGMHWANQGTSMAAPHVTGAIALLFQRQPSLTSDDVKSLFSRTAARDLFTSRVYGNHPESRPSDWWGYGKLDVLAAACELGAGGPVDMLTVSPRVDTLPTGATVHVRACGTSHIVAFESTHPAIAKVDATGIVTAISPGHAEIIATINGMADTARITVVPPSTIVAAGGSAAPQTPVPSRRDASVTMLRVDLDVDGVEAMAVDALTFVVKGADPGARLLVAQDADRNGVLDQRDLPIASAARGTNLSADTIRLLTPNLTIAGRDSIALIVGLQLSGAAPNASGLEIALLSDRIETTGIRSGAKNRVSASAAPIASTAKTTVLQGDAIFSLSENPVRSNRLVFNFRERPATAAIYTLTGRRVLDIVPELTESGGAFEWDLRNSQGTRVAPGVYLLVCSIGGTVLREKILVIGRTGEND